MSLALQLRNKTPKRKVKAKLREGRQPATRPTDVWTIGPYMVSWSTASIDRT